MQNSICLILFRHALQYEYLIISNYKYFDVFFNFELLIFVKLRIQNKS